MNLSQANTNQGTASRGGWIRARLACIALMVSVVSVGTSMTSCGGGGGGGGDPDLVLVGFNLPNISGVALNTPIILTYSAPIDPQSVTLDTLRITGNPNPQFDRTIVDGAVIAVLPQTPSFSDYSDVGLAPGTTYTVSMPTFPAIDTIESTSGKPLLEAETYNFTTTPTITFVEPRRAFLYGVPPSAGGTSDTEGCLQNSQNALYVSPTVDPSVVQTGSAPGANLICLWNQGAPRVIEPSATPRHDQRAVGLPSNALPGFVEIPAIRIPINEPLDPLTVAQYIPTSQLGVNVQLWHVAESDGTFPPFNGIRQIPTNQPSAIQDNGSFEILLVPSGPIPQGTFVINISPAVTDLPGNGLTTADAPSPAIGGYDQYTGQTAFTDTIPAGYKIFFQTLQVPGEFLSLADQFDANTHEWGDLANGDAETINDETGVFTMSTTPADPDDDNTGGTTTPNKTTTFTAADPSATFIGQSTTANWGGGNLATTGFRFMNLDSLRVNEDADSGASALKAVWKPYSGSGVDGVFTTTSSQTIDTTPGSATASSNADAIYEFEEFTVAAGHTLTVSGSRPLVILCRGDVTINGEIHANGAQGGPGLNTDGSATYTNPPTIPFGGEGGAANAGGGRGGNGADPVLAIASGNGTGPESIFGTFLAENTVSGGGSGISGDDSAAGGNGNNEVAGGGAGGGFATAGGGGTLADGGLGSTAGAAFGNPEFHRLLTHFQPDRGYSPMADVTGGTGGGGGGLDDDNGAAELGNATPENGDDGGGGGGAGGGGIMIIAHGKITVAGSIQCNGGAGGNTYAEADQTVDGTPAVTGVNLAAAASGDGGPGGGGSGGGILLAGRDGVEVTAAGSISAVGGAGGASGDIDLVGGTGSDGRIILAKFAGAGGTVVNSGTVNPAPTTTVDYAPTVDLASVAQSDWYDLLGPPVVFAPKVPDTPTGIPQLPVFNSNFSDLTAAGLVQGTDWDAVWEFQGADTLTPEPNATATGTPTPTSATGLTSWEPVSNITAINNKRWVRYRWRFFVADTYNGWGVGTADPLPQVTDVVIPFRK